MATVQKRVRHSGTTTYVVRWYAPDGKEHARGGFRTKKAAEDWAAIEVEPKRRRGIAVDPKAGNTTFHLAAQAWLASRHDLKATTRAAYADALAPTPETGKTARRHKPLADLRIDAVFGGYPLNAITREDIAAWVARMSNAGKRPSTIRNAYFLVRQVLGQAVEDGRLHANPADYVKLPTDHNTGAGAVVDDPSLFLTVEQVRSLVAATPWPYNTLVHVAAWSGLRAAELAGLRVGDVLMPPKPVNPNVPAKLATLRVERTIAWVGGELATVPPKTKGSRRRVPQTAETTHLLRAYLAEHPNADDPTAPLFPSMALTPPRPSGTRAEQQPGIEPGSRSTALRQATALADLSVTEAGKRLVLDWAKPYRHATLYKAVFRPAVLRANRVAAASGDESAALPPRLKFHALRHTYASLCIAAGRPMFEVARFMGHSKPSTTETVYAHLLADDHSDAMAALGAMATGATGYGENVVPLWG